MKITSVELREKFLNFFKSKGHTIIPSASLVPENDPTVLFTTAGMHPLVPFLLGQKHPGGTKLTDVQKCIRTGDIDDVGDDTHLTFFEMMGNWSLGDYWKEDAIKWSFEFLTQELKIPLDRLAFTCFAGDADCPRDEESAKIWKSLGVKEERIAFLPKEDNWWGPAGKTGPCGPDTEMFYWKKPVGFFSRVPKVFDPKNKNWVEIWNDVFMQYVKNEEGKYEEAKQKNVDTGMGLERTLAVLNGKTNIYQTDLFLPIINLLPKNLEEKKKRIIADHSRAIAFLISDGVVPSNKERGYVLRRLIRRIVAYEYLLKEQFLSKVFLQIQQQYNLEFDVLVFENEKNRFLETLENGLKEFAKNTDPFILFTTYGLPIELIVEMAKDQGKKVDLESFNKKMQEHQELSRTASAGMFKGGLADNSEATTKLHTAAHLMLAGLRKVLGQEVYQKGSNITAERLRFDFSWNEKMTSEQINDVENFVNGIIKEDLSVSFEEVSLDKAKEMGAMGVFESKYADKVKVYTVGKGDHVVSREICGGPHVEHTGVMGKFKIQKEESSSAGVRRIKAILE
jgi:alanyl-tRNA synthetase